MAQAGFTPILIYGSTTGGNTPLAANLTTTANGVELAMNAADGKLYYKDSGGTVQVLAVKGSVITPLTNNGVVYVNGSGQATSGSALTFDGTNFVVNQATWQFYVGPNFAKVQNTTGTSASLVLADSSDSTALKNYGSSLAFINSTSEGMRLTSTGLGIGTSSPQNKLVVSNAGAAGLEIAPSYSGLATGPAFYSYNRSGAAWMPLVYVGTSHYFGYGSNPSSSLGMTLDSSGNLGLGVTPSAWASPFGSGVLEFSGGFIAGSSSNNATRYGLNSYYNGSNYIYKTTASASAYVQSSGTHVWYTAPSGTAGNAISFTQAMTLDASGNLLVGFTSIGALTGNGFYGAPTAQGGNFGVLHALGSASGQVYGQFFYNGNVIGSITQNGTTGVLYNLTSDYRLKNNPEALTGSGEFIDALQPKKWQWWDGSGEGVGFIAHEFMEVAKYSGNGEKDAVDADGKPVYQSIQPSSSEVMANLVAEIQSLRKRLAALESK